jgi:hypothetical protein
MGIIAPALVGIRMADRVATRIGRKRGWACASVPTYQTVVDRPTFGLASLTRHGFDTTGRVIEEEVGRGGKKIDKYSTPSDEDCRWKMQSQGKTQEIRTAPRDYPYDDKRNDSLGCHEC